MKNVRSKSSGLLFYVFDSPRSLFLICLLLGLFPPFISSFVIFFFGLIILCSGTVVIACWANFFLLMKVFQPLQSENIATAWLDGVLVQKNCRNIWVTHYAKYLLHVKHIPSTESNLGPFCSQFYEASELANYYF